MSQVNPLTRELLVKLVYYGPGLGGKTTSLQRIHGSSPPETRGQIVSLATPVDRTLYFDFLPLRLPAVRNLHIRLQLFTVPGQVYFNATRKLVLTGADGVVFVADSQRERHDANLESLENLGHNLEEQGRRLDEVPMVLQYNKRDLPNLLGMEEMDRSLNPRGNPSFATCATQGEGVMEALDMLVQRVLDDLEARDVLGHEGVPAEGPEFGRAESALEEQIGRASEKMWRATVDQALSDAPPAARPTSVRPSAAPAPSGARPTAPPAVRGPSWVAWFPQDGPEVQAIEAALCEGRHAQAMMACGLVAEAIVGRVGAWAEVQGPPGQVVSLLGVAGDRWLGFRHMVGRAREGGPVDARVALAAYALVIELRLAEARLAGSVPPSSTT
jgi:mutual gliding-motility protein MglA